MIDPKTLSGLKNSLALMRQTAEGPSTRLLDDIQAVVDSLEEAKKEIESLKEELILLTIKSSLSLRWRGK